MKLNKITKRWSKELNIIEVKEDNPLVYISGLGIKVHPSLAKHYIGPFTKNINWDWKSKI